MTKMINTLADNALIIAALFIAVILCITMIGVILSLYKKERNREKENLYEREFYETVSESEGEFYLLIRMEDFFPVYISKSVQTMFGFTKEEVCADIESLKRIVDNQSRRDFEEELNKWDKRGSLRFEFPYKNVKTQKSGYAEIIMEMKNNFYYVLIRDISNEKEIRMDLESRLDKEIQENKAKSDFLSKMSHEIRTPMNGIIGMLELARMDIDSKEEVEDYLIRAKSLSQFLLTLINDILDMSRIESGKIELERAEIDLFAIGDKLKSMFQNTIEEKGVRFAVEMENFDIRYVIGDELRLTQVIINFISNAVKFTSEGEIVVTFRQMQKRDGIVRLMIRVRDTGKGIEPDFLSRIFKPFEQESAGIAKNYGGSGLGMAIADNMIRLMGGQIVIDSEVGKGSDFTVYVAFPVANREQILPTIEEMNRRSGVQEGKKKEKVSFEGLHILLAEDNDINAEIAITMLEMDGMIVDRAEDGLKAVKMFEESEPGYYRVVLMDIQMPEMNGWDATEKIRALNREDAENVLIYALSANAFVEDKRHSIEVGMNGHISKPIDFDELKILLADNLHRQG